MRTFNVQDLLDESYPRVLLGDPQTGWKRRKEHKAGGRSVINTFGE